MKSKLLTTIIVSVSLLPISALASYNDVTLTTSAVIQVGSYTLNITGTSAVIQSITVNATNLSVTLGSGSSVTISSPTLNQLSTDVSSDVTSNYCNGVTSSLSLAYSGAGTVTNIITPGATLCASAPVNPTSTGSGSGGYSVVNVSHPTATTSATTTPKVVANAAPIFTRDLILYSTGLDVKALQIFLNTHGYPVASAGPGSRGNESTYYGPATFAALLKFQADHKLPATGLFSSLTQALVLKLAKATVPAPIVAASSTPASFTRDLSIGSVGSDVKTLQIFLNAHGFSVAATGPGSSGNESTFYGPATAAAVARFQKAHSVPSTGYFGPKTRTYITSI